MTQEFEERLVVRPFELVEFQIDQKVVGEEILLDLVLRLVCYEPPGVVEMPALNLFYYPSQSLSQATSDTQQNIPARALRVCPSESSSSRPQDRIGLVVFSVNAYLVNPLTTDHLVLSEYIEMMDGNTLIGEGLTSVGEGLRLFNDLLSFFGADEDREGKAIIVFTDAEHNDGLKPNLPLQRARQNKTRVYFVGVGVPLESVLGTLTGVVGETGGDYFDALQVEELREVSRQIDGLERNPVQITEYLRNQALSLPLLMRPAFCWWWAAL